MTSNKDLVLSVRLSLLHRSSISLEDALATKGVPADAVALVYSSESCCFARLINGLLDYASGRKAPLRPFEVRAFCESGELRWLRDTGTETGQAVWLSETPAKETEFPEWERVWNPKEVERPLKRLTYLLWGERSKRQDTPGWITLYEHRIGKLLVPFESETKRLSLTAVEYLDPDRDAFGNVVRVAERLIGLQEENT